MSKRKSKSEMASWIEFHQRDCDERRKENRRRFKRIDKNIVRLYDKIDQSQKETINSMRWTVGIFVSIASVIVAVLSEINIPFLGV